MVCPFDMAKGSLFTTFTGKLGQAVGFVIKNAAGKQTQGLRAYQAQVSNPQTLLQANQRLCLKPLNNFARQMSSIIERGFEGIRYGAASRQEFLRQNMRDFNGPFIRKGDDHAVPGPFLVARGSLVPVSILGFFSNYGYRFAQTDLYIPTGNVTQQFTTIGHFSELIIQENSDVRDGDQITFVAVYQISGDFVYRSFSLLVDSSSTEAFTQVGSQYMYDLGGRIQFAVANDASVSGRDIIFKISGDSSETLVAACVIQSRDGNGAHLRSDARFGLHSSIYASYFSQDALVSALTSYTNQASFDWPVDPITGDEIVNQVVLDLAPSLLSPTPDAALSVRGFVTRAGASGVYVANIGTNQWQVIGPGGSPMVKVEVVEGETVVTPYILSADGITAYITSGNYREWVV